MWKVLQAVRVTGTFLSQLCLNARRLNKGSDNTGRICGSLPDCRNKAAGIRIMAAGA